MGRVLGTAAAGLVVATLALGGCVSVVVGALGDGGGGPAAGGTTSGPGGGGPAVPASWVQLEQAAVAAECPGLPWVVLGAIGRVESDSGRSTLPGVASGANPAGAEGPMQFEPATFARYATVGPGGAAPASPYDPIDAIYSAAVMLCADGGGTAGGLTGAVFAYNHSAVYVDTVMVLAQALGVDPDLGAAPASALAFAAAQFGVPYVWGGAGPAGYDCSGLVQAAYRAAGVDLPRVAQDQFEAGPAVAPGQAEPGDLVFFGDSTTTVEHVGLYLGAGRMIDAPYTGTVVREDPVGTDLVGVTRPGG